MICYPDKLKKNIIIKYKNYGNRGMTLENDLNNTNKYYLEKDIAVIYKKPTPIQIVETNKEKITKAYFKEPSTTDYNGLYKGKYIDFEAKETTSKTNFPLINIHKHQIEHIKNVLKHKGIAFIIVRFTKLNETYLLFGEDFINYIDSKNKKSVALSFFKEKGYLIKLNLKPRLDYIEIVDKYKISVLMEDID